MRIIAAIASFFVVGLGQILKGQTEKGLIFMLLVYFGVPILVYASLAINAYLFLAAFSVIIIGTLVFWVYNIFDALLIKT